MDSPESVRVAVVGAGNGGLAVAGYAALVGHRVSVFDIRDEAIRPLRERMGIPVRGKVEGFAPLVCVSCDPSRVVGDADLIIVVVPGPDQRAAGQAIAPYLREGQLVLVMPGCVGAALELASLFASSGRQVVPVAEADNFVFGCSIPGLGESQITAIKSSFRIAVLPPARTRWALDRIQQVFPQAEPARSVLHTGLGSMNPVLHVAPMVANAGWIEHEGSRFDFYGDGITPSVVRLVEVYDAERLAVAQALGMEVLSLTEWIASTYGVEGSDLYHTVQLLSRDVYGSSPAPSSLTHRYLSEDVPCGTVPTASIGRLLGVPTPLHDRLIHLASLLCEQDFARCGRTAERLGIARLSAPAIRQVVGLES